jgi:hypothetical protein
MRVSLAAFTSEAVAPGGIPWVELSRIMYRDTRRGRAVTIKTNEKIDILPSLQGGDSYRLTR